MMKTITAIVCNEIKIQRSRFIACLYPVTTPDEARSCLAEHSKTYSDATHNCYAYVCGMKGETTYYADAGEPGGTAGKPILNALLRAGLTNCLAVVTRYYGGIKLGVKGLIEAYGLAVEEAVAKAELKDAKELVGYSLSCDYPCYESLKHKLQELLAVISEVEFGQRVSFQVAVPKEHQTVLQEILDGYSIQSRLDYY